MDTRTFIATALASLLLATTSHADNYQTTWFGEEANGQWLAGIKVGRSEPNYAGYNSVDTATVVVGYQFARPIGEGGTASVEFEMSTSNDDELGRNNDYDLNGHWDTQTKAAFMTYRSPGTVYWKGKVGVMNSNIRTALPLGVVEASDTNFAYGVGLGYRAGRYRDINIEGEWVGTSGDADIGMLNVGVHANF